MSYSHFVTDGKTRQLLKLVADRTNGRISNDDNYSHDSMTKSTTWKPKVATAHDIEHPIVGANGTLITKSRLGDMAQTLYDDNGDVISQHSRHSRSSNHSRASSTHSKHSHSSSKSKSPHRKHKTHHKSKGKSESSEHALYITQILNRVDDFSFEIRQRSEFEADPQTSRKLSKKVNSKRTPSGNFFG